MNPGLFDRLITIRQRSSGNSGGSVIYTFSNYKSNIRARFITKNGNRGDVADLSQLTTSVEFIINIKDAPNTAPNMQLIMDDATYRIEGCFEMPEFGRHRYMKIMATLINNNVHL